jgi:hypothetical protein
MKKAILIMVLLISFYDYLNGQSATVASQSCSVILFDDKWLIRTYAVSRTEMTPSAVKSIKALSPRGDISVKSFKNEKLEFSIAIKKKTGEMRVLFTNFKWVKAQDVLKKCESGDKIVVILKDSQHYVLPHFEIEVQGGC